MAVVWGMITNFNQEISRWRSSEDTICNHYKGKKRDFCSWLVYHLVFRIFFVMVHLSLHTD